EDINYNTFRWITSSAGFAMGPSRVNPLTGQILDADIIMDADFLQFWKEEYETFSAKAIADMTGGPLDLPSFLPEEERIPQSMRHAKQCRCELHLGLSRDLAFGHTAMMLQAPVAPANPGWNRKAEQEKLIMQGLKEITMHEVGHTLGLRHNFKASAHLSLDEI